MSLILNDCIEKQEKYAKNSTDWKRIIEDWMSLDDKDNTQRCLEIFETLAETSADYLLCAETWSWLENEKRTKSYLRKIEIDCKTGRDWALLAFDWYGNIENKITAKEYMKKAETLSETLVDWITCASMYYFMEEIGKMPSCVQKAESMAKSANDFYECSHIYNMLGDESNERRCLKKSHKQINFQPFLSFLKNLHLGKAIGSKQLSFFPIYSKPIGEKHDYTNKHLPDIISLIPENILKYYQYPADAVGVLLFSENQLRFEIFKSPAMMEIKWFRVFDFEGENCSREAYVFNASGQLSKLLQLYTENELIVRKDFEDFYSINFEGDADATTIINMDYSFESLSIARHALA